MIKFSVFICNYNNAQSLPEAIRSVLRQTYANWELILVDDGSTDNSLAIIESFAKQDSRIIIIQNPNNLGAGVACKIAVEKSSGEIIGKLDSDDALTEDALEIMARAHEKHPEASLIYSTQYECDQNLKVLRKAKWARPLPPGKSLIQIENSCVTHFQTFKRSAYDRTEGFNPLFKKAVDQDIFLKLEEVGRLVFIDRPLYFYRNNPLGISRGGNEKKAYRYHLLAVRKAYFRRRETEFINISRRRLDQYFKLASYGIGPYGSWVGRTLFFAWCRLNSFILWFLLYGSPK